MHLDYSEIEDLYCNDINENGYADAIFNCNIKPKKTR